MRKNIDEIKYKSILDLKDTQLAIKFVKDNFERLLASKLNLIRVSSPLFVFSSSGLNDHLSGDNKPISFKVKSFDDELEIVQSLAKWKRYALMKYNFKVGEGIYADMNAIRKDEDLDYLHSLYVDQWDFEKIITEDNRNINYLKQIVRKIYSCIVSLKNKVIKKYPNLNISLPSHITFISSSKLERMYPNLTSKEKEDEICRKYLAVFIYQIGGKLKSGKPHDQRAGDYDDWKLNGDLLLYYPLYDLALEILSMGVRVNKESLVKQLKIKHEEEKLNNEYCQAILNDTLPLTIGGGIGQSRLCMYMLNKAHIGEVQSSSWDKVTIEKLKKKNINLL